MSIERTEIATRKAADRARERAKSTCTDADKSFAAKLYHKAASLYEQAGQDARAAECREIADELAGLK